MQGTDEVGAAVAPLATVAAANINVIAADAIAAGEGRLGMTSWTRIFIETPCVPSVYGQLPKAVGYHASSELFAASLGENVTRFSSETRVFEVLVEQILDLVQNPGRITVHSPLRISGRTRKVLIRRVATGSQAGHQLRVADQAARLNAAFNLPRDQKVVLVKKGFPDVKPKGGKRNVDSTAGERKLDCPGWVAELPPANVKAIQVPIAPAERELPGSRGVRPETIVQSSAVGESPAATRRGGERLAAPHPLSARLPSAQPNTTRPTVSNMPI
jgi:hypothetical protein